MWENIPVHGRIYRSYLAKNSQQNNIMNSHWKKQIHTPYLSKHQTPRLSWKTNMFFSQLTFCGMLQAKWTLGMHKLNSDEMLEQRWVNIWLHHPPHSHGSQKMGPSNSSYLSNIAIFHFHDYGRKSSWCLFCQPSEQIRFFSEEN